MTKTQGIWAGSTASALIAVYAIIFYPTAFFQTNAVVGINQCAMMMGESNITAIESFLSEANTTIQQGKASDVMLSASLPVKTDPTQGSGESLETCVEALTNHLNGLKIQQSYQQ